jgi:threonine/homoserine/homoserine lactone efflux protein
VINKHIIEQSVPQNFLVVPTVTAVFLYFLGHRMNRRLKEKREKEKKNRKKERKYQRKKERQKKEKK